MSQEVYVKHRRSRRGTPEESSLDAMLNEQASATLRAAFARAEALVAQRRAEFDREILSQFEDIVHEVDGDWEILFFGYYLGKGLTAAEAKLRAGTALRKWRDIRTGDLHH